jgi:hypothetical protein
MDTTSLIIDRFNKRVLEIELKINALRAYADSLPESNKTKLKYINAINSVEIPRNPTVVDKTICYEIYGIKKIKQIKQIRYIGFYRDGRMTATITNLCALMSGKKQIAVSSVVAMRRQEDGSYRGIDKTMKVREDKNLNGLIAQKVANSRRMSDGSYRGIDKTVRTKKEKGIYSIAAQKTAETRRLSDGTFKGAQKTAETRRQRGYLSTKYGAPCLYQRNSGRWLVMRSMWEWVYAKWLDDNEYEWEYESTVLVTNGKAHVPDFTVNKTEYHEIKPKKFVEERLETQYLIEHSIKVVTEQDFNFNTHKSEAQRYRLNDSNSFRKDHRLQGRI